MAKPRLGITGIGEFLHQRQTFCFGKVNKSDLCALLGKSFHHGSTNAGTAAGDEYPLSLKALVAGEFGGCRWG